MNGYGKYKNRKYTVTATGYSCKHECKLTKSGCLKPGLSLCDGCVVLCKKKYSYPVKKCDKCEHKFKCWTGSYDVVKKVDSGTIKEWMKSKSLRRRRQRW